MRNFNFKIIDENEEKIAKSNKEAALIFGSETEGLFEMIGEEEMKGYPVIHIPMLSGTTRSLNLSNSCSMAMWEFWKQNYVDYPKEI